MRDFLLRAISNLRTTTVSEFEAFHIALELLTWAKLSYTLPLPAESHMAAARIHGVEKPLQSLLTVAADIQLDDAFSTISKLRDFAPAVVDALIQEAERLASNGFLDHAPIDELMPPPMTGSAVSVVIPSELSELMVRLGDLTPEGSIYTPWDFFGRLATIACQKSTSTYLETPIHSGVPRLVQILSSANIEVCYSDPITTPSAIDNGRLRKFDTSLAFPPMGIRYDKSISEADRFGRFPEKTGAGAVLVLRHLLSQTRRRIVVAVPNSLLFSVGVEKSLREELLRQGIVRSVISMPDGLLDSTSAGFAILVLDSSGGHQQVRFVDASAAKFHVRISKTQTRLKNTQELAYLALHAAEVEEQDRTGGAAAATVSVAELQKFDSNLQVNRYVLPDSKKRLLQQLSKTRTVTLKDVITTVRPLPIVAIKARTDSQAAMCEVFEVGALDLPAFGFISHPSRQIEIPSSALNEHATQFLRPLDIVLIVKGTVGKVGIVPKAVPAAGPGGWVVGQSGIVLRSYSLPSIDPKALFMLLRSPLGQMLLSGIVSGATTPLIQLRELLSLQIPDLTMIEQHQAIKALAREHEIQDQLDQLRNEQTTVAANLWSLQ